MTPATEPLTRDRALELFGLIQRVHAERDPALVAEAFTPDVVYEDDGWPEPARGHDEVARFFAAVWRAFPDFEVELVDGPYLLGDGSGFALRGRIGGTMKGPLDPPGLAPTGTRLDVEFGGFYEHDGHRVRRGRVILDQNAVATQLGALPPRGSFAERAGLVVQRLQAIRMRRAS
jgi:predicted ester cyclase